MFVQKEKKSSRAATRAADAIDLVIEFATLGEYGLEYPEPVRESSRSPFTPDFAEAIARFSDQASGGRGADPQRHRQGRRPCRPGRTRVDLPGWSERPGHQVPGVQPGRRHRAEARAEARPLTESRKSFRNRPTTALPEALRPPRIQLKAA